ncbi:MAG TPA: HesA/MoeB/ThiF family protein [Parafilimonas sp.]|nr:HesA/MoeB/ThiF family protein [Parafilimonas sp.]
MTHHKQYERYQRQIILKEFGLAAQEKLLRSKVLVVGAGGLGCPALQYLTAAGVGTVGIVDDDIVSLNNLHRQVLYNMNDIGSSKAEVAAKKLKALNDETKFTVYNERLTNRNALHIIIDYDIVIDGTDNFSSRYMINDACVLLNKPLVYGAISKFEGQVAVFNVKSNKRAVNYRDLFPDIPQENEVLNCADAGVLGVLPGIIGALQANETIKLITGIGKPLINKLFSYNALDNNSYEFNLILNEEAQALIPKNREAFFNMDYEWLCSSSTSAEFEINTTQFDSLISAGNTMIIDVREKDELPFVDEFEHIQIPLNELMSQLSLIGKDDIVVFCQSGKRSLQAAKMLNAHYHQQKKIYSLKGGVTVWKQKKLQKEKQ